MLEYSYPHGVLYGMSFAEVTQLEDNAAVGRDEFHNIVIAIGSGGKVVECTVNNGTIFGYPILPERIALMSEFGD